MGGDVTPPLVSRLLLLAPRTHGSGSLELNENNETPSPESLSEVRIVDLAFQADSEG